MSSKVELLWSPNKEDEFATYGNKLRVYTYTKVLTHILSNMSMW